MSTTKMPGHLLEEIYALGERMRIALESEDVEAFSTLVAERGALLNRLNEDSNTVERSDAWNQIAPRLRDQHKVLATEIAQLETRLQKTLSSLNRFKDAQRSYAGAGPRGGILHDHVQG